jgi:hypothetical protein
MPYDNIDTFIMLKTTETLLIPSSVLDPYDQHDFGPPDPDPSIVKQK